MIVALLGPPGSGKRTLAALLVERLPDLFVVARDVVRAALKNPTSKSAALAQASVECGRQIPDNVFGQLLSDLVPRERSRVLLLGVPRNLAQFESLASAAGQPIHVVHLCASPELIDQRRHVLRLAPIEAHPGRPFAASRSRRADSG